MSALSHPLERVTCIRGDITREEVDVIVNAANESLMGGGGVDGAIHRAAGPGLVDECVSRFPEGCPTGEARLTAGHRLSALHVLHTVGPKWRGGAEGEAQSLAACYANCIAIAEREGLHSMSFPAISCGVYGYPHREAASVAFEALSSALERAPGVQTVRMVLFSEDLLEVFHLALDAAKQRGT